jgi:glycosyltransferase 2 family protein
VKAAAQKAWKLAWRLAVCGLLLAWIFQAIFYDEGRQAWEEQIQNQNVGAASAHEKWQALTRPERFKIALQYGPASVWRTLRTMERGPLILSLILMGATIFAGVVRWQIVLKVHGLDMPLARTTQISLIAHFFNSFLLGSVGGDVLKAYYVARETHHKKTEAVVTVLVDRLIGLFSLLVFACVMLIPNWNLVSTNRLRAVVGLLLCMTGACAIIMLLFFRGGVSKRFPKARELLKRMPKGEMIERSLEAFREFGRNRRFWWEIIPVSIIANVIIILHFLTLTRGFRLHVSPIALGAIVPTVTSISALPITPSGLGIRESLYVLMLQNVGVEAATALLLSLIGFGTSLVWSIIGGLVYLTQRDKQHLQEIEQESESADATSP